MNNYLIKLLLCSELLLTSFNGTHIINNVNNDINNNEEIVRLAEINQNKCPYADFLPSIDFKKGPVVIIDGKENQTYWIFENEHEALTEIKKTECKLIDKLQTTYKLDDFTIEGWRSYSDALDHYYTNEDMREDEYINSPLRVFFEVCDNIERNKRILSLSKEKNMSDSEMASLLPYFSPFYIEYSKHNQQNESRASLNVNDMVKYVNTWNYYYNPTYKPFPSDCTNYVSQVARAGGAKNDTIGNADVDVWYWITKDDYSISWIRADTFVKHFGVAYSYLDFNTFSKKVSRGSFIAYDSESDGKWNHCAFVSEIGGTKTTEGVTYRDFKVAQHTKNYHDWVSSADNGWEKVRGIKAVIKNPSA